MNSEISAGGEIMGEEKRRGDIEDLRAVFSAITDFVREIREPVIDLVKSLMEAVSGKELGEDIAVFYKKLRESGMPDDKAMELTRNYLETRLSVLRELGSMLSKFSTREEFRHHKIGKKAEKTEEKEGD